MTGFYEYDDVTKMKKPKDYCLTERFVYLITQGAGRFVFSRSLIGCRRDCLVFCAGAVY